MIGRRPLAELLGEIADSMVGFASGDEVGVRSLSVRLPIDLRIAITADGLELFGDAPLFRTRTHFDPDPAELAIVWYAVPAEDVLQ